MVTLPKMHRQPNRPFLSFQNPMFCVCRDQERFASVQYSRFSFDLQRCFSLDDDHPLILLLVIEDWFDLIGANDPDDAGVWVGEEGGEGFTGGGEGVGV